MYIIPVNINQINIHRDLPLIAGEREIIMMNTNSIVENGNKRLVIGAREAGWGRKPEVKIMVVEPSDETGAPLVKCCMTLSINSSEGLQFDEVMAELTRRDRTENTVSDLKIGKFGRIEAKADLTYNSEKDRFTFCGERDGNTIDTFEIGGIDMVNALYEARAIACR